MKAMAGAWAVASALALASASATLSTSLDTPVQKVVTLLTDLKAEVESEGTAEATTYDTFACFCKDTTASRSESIISGQDNIDSLSADIQEGTATKASKQTELMERKVKYQSLSAELSAAQVRCMQELTTFEAKIADLGKALGSTDKAITALEGAKSAAALLQIRGEVSQSLAVASALHLIEEPKERQLQSFLQGGVDPNDPEYHYRSTGILDLLGKLKTDFTDSKTQTETQMSESKTACDELKATLTDQLEETDGFIQTLKGDIDALDTSIANDRQSLVEAESLLQDDQSYLKTLTEQCEARAKDWDQRSQARANEIRALSEALTILTEGKGGAPSVADMDAEVNARALLQKPKEASAAKKSVTSAPKASKASTASKASKVPVTHVAKPAAKPAAKASAVVKPLKVQAKKPLSFLQVRASPVVAAAVATTPKPSAAVASRKDHVAALLNSEAARLKSSALSNLASKVADDPFIKVKKLVQDLIEKLLEEATAEATQKGFCDTEIAKSTKSRDFRYSDVNNLLATLGSLEAKKESLELDITTLTESIATLTETLSSTSAARAAEKEENLKTIQTARSGAAAVGDAINILKSFYTHAAKAAAFVQAREDPDAGFSGGYAGKQAGAEGIIGILEVVKSDFERTVKLTENGEKKAAEDYVLLERETKADKAGKETSLQLSQQALTATGDAIVQKETDLKNAQSLLDDALKAYEDLKPMCLDTGMSYAERTAKRDEEINALKSALCMLDPEKVEEECKNN